MECIYPAHVVIVIFYFAAVLLRLKRLIFYAFFYDPVAFLNFTAFIYDNLSNQINIALIPS